MCLSPTVSSCVPPPRRESPAPRPRRRFSRRPSPVLRARPIPNGIVDVRFSYHCRVLQDIDQEPAQSLVSSSSQVISQGRDSVPDQGSLSDQSSEMSRSCQGLNRGLIPSPDQLSCLSPAFLIFLINYESFHTKGQTQNCA
jgi:hypothetical protein